MIKREDLKLNQRVYAVSLNRNIKPTYCEVTKVNKKLNEWFGVFVTIIKKDGSLGSKILSVDTYKGILSLYETEQEAINRWNELVVNSIKHYELEIETLRAKLI